MSMAVGFFARRAASRDLALLGLVPAGILTAILGGLFYRVRRRDWPNAQAAAEQRRFWSSSRRKDPADGLPNRTVFMERLEQALSPGTQPTGERLLVCCFRF